jgi:putative hydrolase of the HAD superfamily
VIYFDIDDTLLDYKRSQELAAREFVDLYSSHVRNPDAFVAEWDRITEQHMARYLAGELTFQEQRRCRIIDSLGLDLSPTEADEIFDDYYQAYEASWCLFPDVEIALDKLTNVSKGIITNGDKGHQRFKLEKLGVLRHFEVIITPACAGAPKPELAIFKLGAERAGKLPSACWYVGDNYVTDYHAAKDAGYRSVWLNRHNSAGFCESQCKDLHGFVDQVLE